MHARKDWAGLIRTSAPQSNFLSGSTALRNIECQLFTNLSPSRTAKLAAHEFRGSGPAGLKCLITGCSRGKVFPSQWEPLGAYHAKSTQVGM